MSESIEQLLDEIDRYCERATQGPWEVEYHQANGDYVKVALVSRSGDYEGGYYVVASDDMAMRRAQSIIDFSFAKRARADLPRLSKELRERIALQKECIGNDHSSRGSETSHASQIAYLTDVAGRTNVTLVCVECGFKLNGPYTPPGFCTVCQKDGVMVADVVLDAAQCMKEAIIERVRAQADDYKARSDAQLIKQNWTLHEHFKAEQNAALEIADVIKKVEINQESGK